MAAADEPLRYRRLRAPTEDQTALIEPSLSEAKTLVAANRAKALEWDRLSGGPFSICRREGRFEFLLFLWLDSQEDRPLILSGHQPTLFHPGVWLKSFVLSRLAADVGGIAVNLTIDSDTIRTAGIRVPTSNSHSPQVIDVPFDAASAEVPWEERRILDRQTFETFAHRATSAYKPLRNSQSFSAQPLVLEHLWGNARRLASPEIGRQPPLLGEALAWARHQVERDHGLNTEEESLSNVCNSLAFYYFLEYLLSRVGEFHSVYNAALAEYRVVNRVASKSHPVPDLAKEGDWLEMPFWIWESSRPERRRMFVRKKAESWEVTDRADIRMDAAALQKAMDVPPTLKVRPRALITTMYARLILSDLFIHGIGGAKYDEVTDAIIRRFFNIEPPAYVTATATVRLPVERPEVSMADLSEFNQRYRGTFYHPERFVDDYSGHHRAEFAALVAQKQDLIAHGWREKQKKAWHDQMKQCNERLSALLEPLRDQLRQERERLVADLHRSRLLGSREYSFCLFPEEMLVPLLKKMAGIQS